VNPRARPLVAVTLALLAGLLPALRFGPPPLALLVVSLVTLVVATQPALLLPPRTIRILGDAPLLVVFGCVGALLGAQGARAAATDCRASLRDGARVEAVGLLGASTLAGGDATRSLLPLEGARLRSGRSTCARAVRVGLPDRVALRAGSEIRVRGEWIESQRPVVASRWPADPLYAGFVSVDTVLAAAAPRALRHPLLVARGRAEERLARLFPGHFPLAEALLLGRRERLDDAVKERFVRAGLVHLLAISGAHVALFGVIFLLVGDAARLPRDRARLATIALTAAYLGLIGSPGSALRAGIMLSLTLVARLLQRPCATLPIVAAATIGLVILDPRSVLDPGVQRSFAGVGALMLASRVPVHSLHRRLRHGPARAVAEACVVSVVAFAVTAPITAYHFAAGSPVAIVANLPAVPLTSLALVATVAALAADMVFSPLARLLADGGAVALDAVDATARWAAAVPYGYLHVARPEWALWGVVALATLVAMRFAGRLSAGMRAGVAAGVALSVVLAWPAPGVASADALEIHFVDVGQGDAIAIRSPAGRWVLIDAGPRARGFDAGQRRVLPFLSAHGARRLEALILTHPDADHIGGAPAVVRGVRVGRVVEPGLAVGRDLYLELLAETEKAGIPWARAERGRVLRLDGVELRFLWPDPHLVDSAPEANYVSSVVQLRYGGFSALLTGDAPTEVERILVERDGAALSSPVLKAGHHGSATSTSTAFLDAVHPQLVVISVGARNRYGHPAPEVLARLRARGISIARTDREGTVSIRVGAAGGYRWERVP
jgi:competence protein ComEC